MLPPRIATRLKLLGGVTLFAVALPAFTGFDRMGDGEAKRAESGWASHAPFSLDAWRTRVGTVQEAIRVFVDGSPNKIEPAHPPQETLFGAGESGGEVSPLTAYAPTDGWLKGGAATGEDITNVSQLIGDDGEAFAQAYLAFKNGDFAAGDAAAARLKARLPETAARWAGLKYHPKQAGFGRIAAFLEEHPDWPGADFLRRHAEEYLVAERQPDAVTRGFFLNAKPLTGYGKYMLARALAHDGAFDDAATLAREAWREADLSGLESSFYKELGDLLRPADHRFRIDRLLYGAKFAAALRTAEVVSPDLVAATRARLSTGVANATPADPFLYFARLRMLRNANKFAEAGALLRKAPTDPELVVDGDAWWEERRTIARKLLDQNDAPTAYVVCAQHAAKKTNNKVEAEFNAGWIALRFLNDADKAARHFALLADAAETPLQKSRALYWQGRAAEAAHTPADDAQARLFYADAAAHSTSFYGQLAAARIGADDKPLRAPPVATQGDRRHESVRAVELMLAAGDRDTAASLALDAGKYLTAPGDVAALGNVITRQQDAKLSLLYGKQAAYRGVALDDVAFPAIGVPKFDVLPGSAPRSMVFAIARQESAFDARAISHAGAMGLMQMIASTAHATAVTKRVPFELSRMLNEPAYNAQLGAAHLGILLHDYRGAYLLTFAAYNAGGGRVKQWIDAYGDPRKPNVDPIDWVERIPIAETRNYVQRVMENFVVYRAKFADTDSRAPQVELARAGDSL